MKFARIYIFLFFVLLTPSLWSQPQLDRKLDSLDGLLKKAKADTLQLQILHTCAYACLTHAQFKRAKPFIEKARKMAQNINWQVGQADQHHLEGVYVFYLGKYDQSLKHNLKAVEIRKKRKDYAGLAASYGNIGLIYQVKGNFARALDYQFLGLRMEEKLKNDDGIAASYSNMGLIFERLGDFKKALEYYRKARRMRIKMNDERELITVYSNMGNVYLEFKNYDSAMYYHRQSMSLAKKHQNENAVGMALSNIGNTYYEQKQYDKALEHQLKCIEIAEKIGDERVWVAAMGSAGAAYNKLNMTDKALEYTQKSINKARQMNSINQALQSLYGLSDIYEKQGKWKEAGQVFKEYVALRDSLVNEEKKNEIARKEIEYEFAKKEEKRKQIAREQNRKQQLIIYSVSFGLALVLVFSFFIFRSLRANKRKNKIIEEQKLIVEEKQKEILDSINYARKIQYALLAHDDLLRQNLPEHFVLFKPKDIVSGDFYWGTFVNASVPNGSDSFYLAVCDSTGHGVPGAFMSLLNISFLNEAINEKGIEQPNEVFNHVRKRLIENLSHEGSQDGMDATLLRIEVNDSNFEIEYAAAYNAPVIIRKGEIIECVCDKMPIGKGETTTNFRLYKLNVQKGDMLYLYTDGYADQFGGPKGKKFKESNFKKLLQRVHSLPISVQKQNIETEIEDWMNDHEQVDDICIIGIRL